LHGLLWEEQVFLFVNTPFHIMCSDILCHHDQIESVYQTHSKTKVLLSSVDCCIS